MDSPAARANRLSIGALLDILPGDCYRDVRKPPRSLLWRLQQTVSRQIHPEVVEAVRGVGVAGDNLLHALLKGDDSTRFTLFLEPGQPVGEQAQAVLRSRGLNHEAVSVHSRTAILSGTLTETNPDVWLDIYGTIVPAVSVRNHFAPHPYPITSLQHAFSSHDLLYERFLRLILTGSQPYDSIVSTSHAGKRGIENLLCHLSAAIERDLGISARFQGRVDMIPLCVDTETYKPCDKAKLRKALDLPQDAIVLIYVGYLAPLKADLLPVLPVFKKLVENNPDKKLILLLAGTGWPQYQKLLLTRARELSIHYPSQGPFILGRIGRDQANGPERI